MFEAVQGKQARMLEGIMVSEQKDELPITTVKSAVLCQVVDNSDKDNNMVSDYWAQEGKIAGADGHGEELQQLQHHHHGGEGKEQHAGPGHVVQDDIGHMDDIPGKANQQYHPNFSVAGLVGQGAVAGEQGEEVNMMDRQEEKVIHDGMVQSRIKQTSR